MRSQEAVRGEPWMTSPERTRTRKFVIAVRQFLKRRGVEDSPLLALRINDLCVHWLLVQRQEVGLMTTETGEVPLLGGALADQIGKGRERLRKSIRELEDACARLGKPIDVGIAEQLLPMVEKTRDLLQDEPLPPEAGEGK